MRAELAESLSALTGMKSERELLAEEKQALVEENKALTSQLNNMINAQATLYKEKEELAAKNSVLLHQLGVENEERCSIPTSSLTQPTHTMFIPSLP